MLRFAISPTGDINIENLRIALLNHIVSKQTNQELLIRIDDTVKEKNIEKKDKEIIKLLDLFGIDYSRVILQSENIKYHTGMGMKLLLDKKAFNCFCSDEAIESDKQKAQEQNKPYSYSGFCENISDETKFHCNAPFVVRMKKPEHNIKFKDFIQGECEYQPYKVDSVIILNHDKSPTLNFASAVDDMLYDISTIIQEEKYLENTPKQIHIREALGYEKEIQYIDIPTIQTDTPISVQSLIDEGYLPVAIANYLVLLGYDAPCGIFTIEEALEWFDINKLSNKPVKFDKKKLNFINQEYLKTIDDMKLSKIIGYADEDIGKLAKIYIKEYSTTKDIKEKIDTIFSKKEEMKEFKEEYKILQACLSQAPFIDNFEDLKKYIMQHSKLTEEKLLKPLQYILTGAEDGPNLEDIYPFIKNYLGEIIC